jgi:hypothetical protein
METQLNIFQSLLIDAQELSRSAQQDYSNKQWKTYDMLITEFNRIISELDRTNIAVGISEISRVPKKLLEGYPYVGRQGEQEKLREIVNASARLATKLAVLQQDSQRLEPDAVTRVEAICDRFHSVAKGLRKRHEQRPTLDVKDEYDVQDLLRSLLAVDFDDVRPEEWTPSYAGRAARMDFLLKSEQIIVETKMTRDGLSDKELGEQLIVDINKYAQHPDCKTLVCFIYDPSGYVANPAGLQTDLEKQPNGTLAVRVLVRPS